MVQTTTTQPNIAELSALYDRIYDIADRLLKKHNPCNIHKDGKRFSCTYRLCGTRLCCGKCHKYWDKGCTVKALGCKLFLCGAIRHKVLQRRFRKLREYGRIHLSFILYFSQVKCNYSIVDRYYISKEDWLKQIENKL